METPATTAADSGLAAAWREVLGRIGRAQARFGRAAGPVRLLAVSKTFPPEAIRCLAALGQREFGESYLQEALPKLEALADLGLIWHFIGPIQSNKTRQIAAHFSWVHGVDRLKIAQRLSEQRPAQLGPLEVCLQVNISGEASKSGVTLEELPPLAAAVAALPRLRLRGLMALPAPTDDFEAQRAAFCRLRQAFDALVARGLALDTLSMGMSDDLEAAIAEGSTLVRVGSAIFGARIQELNKGHES